MDDVEKDGTINKQIGYPDLGNADLGERSFACSFFPRSSPAEPLLGKL